MEGTRRERPPAGVPGFTHPLQSPEMQEQMRRWNEDPRHIRQDRPDIPEDSGGSENPPPSETPSQ